MSELFNQINRWQYLSQYCCMKGKKRKTLCGFSVAFQRLRLFGSPKNMLELPGNMLAKTGIGTQKELSFEGLDQKILWNSAATFVRDFEGRWWRGIMVTDHLVRSIKRSLPSPDKGYLWCFLGWNELCVVFQDRSSVLTSAPEANRSNALPLSDLQMVSIEREIKTSVSFAIQVP